LQDVVAVLFDALMLIAMAMDYLTQKGQSAARVISSRNCPLNHSNKLIKEMNNICFSHR
jgi:hypothetical protein